MFFAHKKLKKTTLKSCSEILNFFPPIAARTDQTEEFMFQNVAYRPNVYKTGSDICKKSEGPNGHERTERCVTPPKGGCDSRT